MGSVIAELLQKHEKFAAAFKEEVLNSKSGSNNVFFEIRYFQYGCSSIEASQKSHSHSTGDEAQKICLYLG